MRSVKSWFWSRLSSDSFLVGTIALTVLLGFAYASAVAEYNDFIRPDYPIPALVAAWGSIFSGILAILSACVHLQNRVQELWIEKLNEQLRLLDEEGTAGDVRDFALMHHVNFFWDGHELPFGMCDATLVGKFTASLLNVLRSDESYAKNGTATEGMAFL